MNKQSPNVQNLDVHPLDIVCNVFDEGLNRLRIRRRSIKLDFWRVSLLAEEAVTTVERTDDRN
jgi:hypothetical protein